MAVLELNQLEWIQVEAYHFTGPHNPEERLVTHGTWTMSGLRSKHMQRNKTTIICSPHHHPRSPPPTHTTLNVPTTQKRIQQHVALCGCPAMSDLFNKNMQHKAMPVWYTPTCPPLV